MKKLILIIGLLSAGLAQAKNDKVLVTDFYHYLAYHKYAGLGVDTEKFPDYFSDDPSWTTSMRLLADSLTRTQFTSAEVLFLNSNIEFQMLEIKGLAARIWPVRRPNLDNISRTQADLFITFVSTIEALSVGPPAEMEYKPYIKEPDVYVFYFHTKVEDKHGKVVHRKKSQIKFTAKIGDSHFGTSQLERAEFQRLYEDALRNSFKEQKSRAKTREVKFLLKGNYDDFMARCQRFQLEETGRHRGGAGDYQLKQRDKTLGHIKITTRGMQRELELTEILFDLDPSYRLKQKSKLNNGLTKEKYKVIAGRGIEDDLAEVHLADYDDATVSFQQADGAMAKFAMLGYDSLIGYFRDEWYAIKHIYEDRSFKIYHDNNWIGLIQIGRKKKENGRKSFIDHAYFTHDLTAYEIGVLLNIYFAFQLAYEIEMEPLREEMGN